MSPCRNNSAEVSKVFRLDPNVEDPRYEGFGYNGELNYDFMPDDILSKGRAWTVPHVAHSWVPLPVCGRVRPYNDYPCIALRIPAFSERAIEVLRDMLEPNGELLPLSSSVGKYYAYNITTVADALDQEHSEIEWYKGLSTPLPSEVIRYEFLPDKLSGLTIFRLVEEPAHTYVTDVFVERVRARGLRGFVFRELWPKSLGDGETDEDKEGPALTAESVIVVLGLAKPKPSKVEKQRVEDLMDKIDTWTYEAEKEGKYLGSLHGNEYARREYRLFMECPSANALGDWLAPRLRDLAWDGTATLVKRFGPFDTFGEADFPEERISLK